MKNFWNASYEKLGFFWKNNSYICALYIEMGEVEWDLVLLRGPDLPGAGLGGRVHVGEGGAVERPTGRVQVTPTGLWSTARDYIS